MFFLAETSRGRHWAAHRRPKGLEGAAGIPSVLRARFPRWGRRQIEKAALFWKANDLEQADKHWDTRGFFWSLSIGSHLCMVVILPTFPNPDGRYQKLPADCQCWPGVFLMESLGGTCLQTRLFLPLNSLWKKTKKIRFYYKSKAAL